MRMVVTGSQSFIGRRFVRAAEAAGHIVTGIDALPGAPGDAVMDVRDDALAGAIPVGADVVVHLAAISRDGDCRNDPQTAFDVNVTGTLNVARVCRERGVGQLVFASSEWVYGAAASSVQREDDPIDVMQLNGEYALSKIVAERALGLACPRDLANVTVLRFGIVYGPRPANWSAVESLADKVANDKAISVGSLATARRFIHVDDIATGILAALGRTGFEIFNLSGSVLVTLADVIAASGGIYGTRPAVTETNPAAASIRNPDNTRAMTLLGWRPSVDLTDGIRTLFNDGALVLSK